MYCLITSLSQFLVNTGYNQRSNFFRKEFASNGEFQPATFFGRLHHVLISTESPLPPGSKIYIELDKSCDEFVIMRPATDTDKYRIRILDIALYVPIAQLSQSVFSEYNSLLTRPKDNKAGAVSLHFRRSEVRPVSIPVNAQEFYSGKCQESNLGWLDVKR